MFERFYNGETGSKLETLEPLLNAFLMGKSGLIVAHGETGKLTYYDPLKMSKTMHF